VKTSNLTEHDIVCNNMIPKVGRMLFQTARGETLLGIMEITVADAGLEFNENAQAESV
jgi:hypothetical protein